MWYQPYYYAGTVYYSEVSPPVGYAVDSLPDTSGVTVVSNGTTYYYDNGVYYTQQNGQYVVADNPDDTTSQTVAPDPTAIAQLQRMADFLATVQAGRFTIRENSDEILDSGQKVQVESWQSVAFRSPDRMAIDFISDGVIRRTVYDGQTITVFENGQNVYAQQTMPPTLSETLDVLASKYGMAVPAAELLRPGLMGKLRPQIRSAQYLGAQTIGSDNCQLVTFSLDWADVQIWILDGQKALPRQMVISYKKIPSTPKYVMSFTDWNLSSPQDSAFKMNLPSGAVKIETAELGQKAQDDQ